MICERSRRTLPPLEMWGGIEASVTRIGGDCVDQIRLTGHDERPQDLDDFAALGITAIRYPVLWERVAPGALADADWRWADERLGRLRELGIRPIAGLLHHGNGPLHTELTAPDFAAKFAEYAARVAERYPWLDAYTPINEPLTTARFCGLYGHWHPHARDPRIGLKILVNQIAATRLAMRAIRAVNPAAQLVQTEDLGAAHSTPRLARRARFENERRWLTMDLLTGRVGREHPLWSRFAEAGLEGELALLADDPCPPDIIGIDHYLTSERFLDERVERYPDRAPTSGGGEPYADIEAIRVLAEGVSGFERLAAETWARYRLPMAATEVHLGCTREEQLRWLAEIWESCRRLRKAGTDIRAVTAWALLGSYDWNSLMTRRVGYYEPGVFDLRATRPRRTALARLVRELADHGTATHPVLAAPGWWHRPDRFTYAPVRSSPFALPARPWRVAADGPEPRPILITGGGGRLACAVARLCVVRGLPYRMLARAELDAAELNAVLAAIEELRPWAIVNAAGFARVASAVHDADRCWRDNVGAAHVLAHACAAARIPLLSFSSHLVFDGAKHSPYTESDAPAPLSVYGATKAEAERAIIAAYPQALVIRAGALFGPWDGSNFVARTLAALRRGREVAASEAVVTPSYLPDLANAALDLLIDGESGIWHLAHSEPVSWADLARAAARHAALDPARIRGLPGDAAIAGAARPRYSALGSDRAALMPSLDSALARCIAAQAAEAAAIEETALEDIAALAVG